MRVGALVWNIRDREVLLGVGEEYSLIEEAQPILSSSEPAGFCSIKQAEFLVLRTGLSETFPPL